MQKQSRTHISGILAVALALSAVPIAAGAAGAVATPHVTIASTTARVPITSPLQVKVTVTGLTGEADWTASVSTRLAYDVGGQELFDSAGTGIKLHNGTQTLAFDLAASAPLAGRERIQLTVQTASGKLSAVGTLRILAHGDISIDSGKRLAGKKKLIRGSTDENLIGKRLKVYFKPSGKHRYRYIGRTNRVGSSPAHIMEWSFASSKLRSGRVIVRYDSAYVLPTRSEAQRLNSRFFTR